MLDNRGLWCSNAGATVVVNSAGKKDDDLTRLFMGTFGRGIDSQGKTFPMGSTQSLGVTFRTLLFCLLVIEIVELNRDVFLKAGKKTS